MIKLISTRQKLYIALFSLFAFLITSVAGGYVVYRYYMIRVDNSARQFDDIFRENFTTNERVADVISVRYMQQLTDSDDYNGKIYPNAEYDATRHIYGVNLHKDKNDPEFNGTLQCVSPVENKTITLVKSIDYTLNNNQLPKHYTERTRYFYFSNGNCIYLLKKTPLERYVFDPVRAKKFNVFSSPDSYAKRKFSNVKKLKGMVHTQVFADRFTKSKTFGTISYVLDLRKDEKALGVLLSDNNEIILRENYYNIAKDLISNYMSLKLVLPDKKDQFTDANNEFRLAGNEDHLLQFMKQVNDNEYVLSIDPVGFLIFPPEIIFSNLIALFISVTIYIFLASYLTKHNRENICDHLTKVYNRKALDLLYFKKDRCDKTLAAIDCNKFKAINDTYGHDMGDKALAYVATRLHSEINKKGDVLIRLGGDEFCVIFGNSDTISAAQTLKKANYSMKDFHKDISLSISYGITEIVPDEPVIEAIKRADIELYHAKKRTHGNADVSLPE